MISRDAERLPFVVRAWYEAVWSRWRVAGGSRRAGDSAAAGDAAVPDPRRRCHHGADGPDRVGARDVSALRRRTRPGGHHAGRRSPADLQPLPGALAVRPDHVPVLPQRGPQRRSRRSPAATAATGSRRATSASAISRPTTHAGQPARSCRPSMPSRPCRWTQRRCSGGISKSCGAAFKRRAERPTSDTDVRSAELQSRARVPCNQPRPSRTKKKAGSVAAGLEVIRARNGLFRFLVLGEHVRRLVGQPVEQVPRFPEAARCSSPRRAPRPRPGGCSAAGAAASPGSSRPW